MNSIFQNILGLVLVYKYITLFFIAFLSSVGIPLPAGSSTMASAAFASQGYFNIFAVMAVGASGNIIGDVFMYTLSKKYGKKILYFFHLQKFVDSEPLKYAEKVENNYSALVVITSRFQDQFTTLVNILAGLGRMNFKRFLIYVTIGDVLQIIFFSSIGYFFAENWQSLYKALGVFSWLIVLVAGIILILLTGKLTKRMMK